LGAKAQTKFVLLFAFDRFFAFLRVFLRVFGVKHAKNTPKLTYSFKVLNGLETKF
jgi:hypothetical protein